MTIRLRNMPAAEIDVLKRLDDGYPEEDHVGVPSHRFSVAELWVWEALWIDGLADYSEGWDRWILLCLTERGRELKTTGQTK